MVMKAATIYHNPKCTTSTKVLAYLQDHDYEITVINYLDAGLTPEDYIHLMDKLENKDKILRMREEEYKSLQPKPNTDEEIAKAMSLHPRIQERPIVLIGDRGIVARPYEYFVEWIEN